MISEEQAARFDITDGMTSQQMKHATEMLREGKTITMAAETPRGTAGIRVSPDTDDPEKSIRYGCRKIREVRDG